MFIVLRGKTMFFNFSCPEQTEYQAEKFPECLKFCQQKELLG